MPVLLGRVRAWAVAGLAVGAAGARGLRGFGRAAAGVRGTMVPINSRPCRCPADGPGSRRASRGGGGSVVTTMRGEPSVAEYLEAARSWDLDRAQTARRSATRAWRVAAVSVLLTVLALVAVAGLTPLKTVEPFLIRVDHSTGIVDVVPVLKGRAEVPEAVTRYFITQYVQSRERYLGALAESDYEQTGAFHSPQMNQAWAAAWDRGNPDSPLNRYADGSTVRVQVNCGVVPVARQRAGGPGAGALRHRATAGRAGRGAGHPLRGHAAVCVWGTVEGRSAARGQSARVQGARIPPGARSAAHRSGSRGTGS